MTLCDRFPALTPFSIRKEKMVDVFRLISKYNEYSKKEVKKANQPKVIRRPAGDDWF